MLALRRTVTIPQAAGFDFTTPSTGLPTVCEYILERSVAKVPITQVNRHDRRGFLVRMESKEAVKRYEGTAVFILKQEITLKPYHVNQQRTFILNNFGVPTLGIVSDTTPNRPPPEQNKTATDKGISHHQVMEMLESQRLVHYLTSKSHWKADCPKPNSRANLKASSEIKTKTEWSSRNMPCYEQRSCGYTSLSSQSYGGKKSRINNCPYCGRRINISEKEQTFPGTLRDKCMSCVGEQHTSPDS
ncbi:hypothetical protein FQN54_006509 [Arachnomyces sp. PD_36]|nr:hypothetical protein FQN54_006509 [Arachnomyces sp. PD_36]